MEDIGTIPAEDGTPIAFRRLPGRGPGIVFLGGFKSDMTGSKAEAIASLASATGRPCLRFDYSGHGASGGRFEDGTITAWLAQVCRSTCWCGTMPRGSCWAAAPST